MLKDCFYLEVFCIDTGEYRMSPLEFHERDVGLVILICEESRQSAVAPLGDMMGDAGGHDACDASHGSMISILFALM